MTAEKKKNYGPILIAACIGAGIGIGTAISNNIGLESRPLRILAGAVAAAVIAMIGLGIVQLFTKKKS